MAHYIKTILTLYIGLDCFLGTPGADVNSWRKRVIYQILTDRFSPEGPTPSEQCLNERSWCGGTYKGIIQRLDYIKNLGADAIWISPMVLNTEGGYHGYWAENIYEIDPHYGSRQDLVDLIDACHLNDMFIMLDVVPNHMGYPSGCSWDECPTDVINNMTEMVPFDELDHYHTLCAIEDYNNQTQVEECRLANLPDLNQTVPYVRSTLLDWINSTTFEYGFDGYRIDTARHIAMDFWPEYQAAAGVYTLGEVGSENIQYTAEYQGPLTSVLNYPLYFTLRKIINEQILDFTDLRNNLEEQKLYLQDTTILGTFIDNHDQDRFMGLSNDQALLRNALAYILFAEGVPIIYFGTEQAFSGVGDPENRDSLWPYYDENTDMYKFISSMLSFRKANVEAICETSQGLNQADADTFVFTKNNSQILVFVSRVGQGQQAEADVSLQMADGTVYQNIIDVNDTLIVNNGVVQIRIADGEPRVYVMSSPSLNTASGIHATWIVLIQVVFLIYLVDSD